MLNRLEKGEQRTVNETNLVISIRLDLGILFLIVGNQFVTVFNDLFPLFKLPLCFNSGTNIQGFFRFDVLNCFCVLPSLGVEPTSRVSCMGRWVLYHLGSLIIIFAIILVQIPSATLPA